MAVSNVKTTSKTTLRPVKNNTEIIAKTFRIVILASGIYQVFFGETAVGLITLASLALISFPSFFSRGKIRSFPLEIEIIFFIMVIVQFILGEARDFYIRIPYYDKFVHYLLPMFIGLITFLLTYTLAATGRLRMSPTVTFVVIILLTLGIGAAWEIFEYASDAYIYPYVEGWHHFQGNANQDAITDTMSDLIIDTLGGIFGAILGVKYITRLTKQGSGRVSEITGEIAQIFN